MIINNQLVKIKIDVLQDDIAAGMHDCEKCPIALAILRLFNSKIRVEVTGWYLKLHKNKNFFSDLIPLPPEAKHFTRCFDDGNKVLPFSFEVLVNKYYFDENTST